MKKIFLLMALVVSGLSFSQSLNDYKYASIPERFSIFKNDNYIRLNNLAKLYMQKYGFEAYMASETQPQDFANNYCNKIFVDLTETNTLFTTKVKVVIKDCNGKILATSGEGVSREKEFQAAYNEAVRMAFTSFPELVNHKYEPKNQTVQQQPVAAEESGKFKIDETVQTLQVQTNVPTASTSTLYAQPIENGYQLIDSQPKVIMKIYKTSARDFYTAVKGTVQGVLISRNGAWFFEYYVDNKLITEKFDIKF